MDRTAICVSINGEPTGVCLSPQETKEILHITTIDTSFTAGAELSGTLGALTVSGDSTGTISATAGEGLVVGGYWNPIDGAGGVTGGVGGGLPGVGDVEGVLSYGSDRLQIQGGAGAEGVKVTIAVTWTTSETPVLKQTLNSPVSVIVSDPSGRKLGYDPRNGTYYQQIPNSSYSGPYAEPQSILIGDLAQGNYTMILIPIAAGSFTFQLTAFGGLALASNLTYTGTVSNAILRMILKVQGEGRNIMVIPSSFSTFNPAGYDVTFHANPANEGLISWGSCGGPNYEDGQVASSLGGSVTACYVPSGYTFQSWTCTDGLSCSAYVNPTVVTVTGPGTITLNLKTGSLSNPVSTSLTATATPGSLSGGALFTVCRTLTSNGIGVGGEQILLVFNSGSNIIAVTTQSDGSFSKQVTAPISTGSYEEQLLSR